MFDHPWIVLIAVAIGLLRWLSQKRETAKQDSRKARGCAPTNSSRG